MSPLKIMAFPFLHETRDGKKGGKLGEGIEGERNVNARQRKWNEKRE